MVARGGFGDGGVRLEVVMWFHSGFWFGPEVNGGVGCGGDAVSRWLLAQQMVADAAD